jgi:hypothetical protein
MTNCKSCGTEISEAAAGASIFAMSFLPAAGRKVDRTRATAIAKKIGPLCRWCLETCTDLESFVDLKTRILQAVREYDGQLDWQGLAAIVGVDPLANKSEPLVAFQQAVTALRCAETVRLEFDDQGIVRFWADS